MTPNELVIALFTCLFVVSISFMLVVYGISLTSNIIDKEVESEKEKQSEKKERLEDFNADFSEINVIYGNDIAVDENVNETKEEEDIVD